jgi:hypothetical protein
MSYNLVLNSNNAINNTTFQYQFINGSFTIHDEAEICISNIQIPYSWYNVAPVYNNQTFQIIFPASTSTFFTGTVTITAGFYSINDINAFLQQYCITNGLYLINSVGQYVYYLTFLYNTTYYGVQLITNLVPTSLPSGWTAPTNWVGYHTTSLCPQLIIINNFGKLIGFLPGTYPSTNTINESTLNTFTPLGSTVNSLVIRCSLVDNQVGVPTDILDTMPVDGTFGSNINYQPPSLKWIKLTAGTYQYLTITFVDQNLNSILAQDPNVTISILLNNKGKEVKEKVIPKLNITI